jgi:putative peptidoglycan lipid II flippase
MPDEAVPPAVGPPEQAGSGSDAEVEIEAVEEASVLRSSALMSVGTVISRASGVVRGAALAAAIGVSGPVADLFGLGNTLPNIVYILVIGGALNAVFVPQLVRHMRQDADKGDGFADRLVTLVCVILLVTTIVSVAAAPWIVDLYTSNKYTPEQVALAVDITRYCLPQIFFYGAYTMLSQVLNARGRFGAPMFAPIVNNLVAISAFLTFFWLWGTAPARDGMLTPTQTAVLGIGSTLGVAAQAAVLIPVMWRSGYHYRPRFDWRGAGLGRAGSLAFWTVGLVLVNQVAYVFIVRLLGTAGVLAEQSGSTQGGLVTYQNAHLIFILPHSIITVSLVTALLPRMSRAAAAADWTGLAEYVAGGTRTAAAAIIPAAAALFVLGPPLAEVLFGYGAANDNAGSVLFLGQVVSVFALGLLPFTVFYLVVRGWYALEATRTAFWVTVVLNVLNLGLAYAFFDLVIASGRAGANAVTGIAAAYVVAYWLTAGLAWWLMARRLGGLQTGRTVRRVARMLAAGLGALVVMALVRYGSSTLLAGRGKLADLLVITLVGLAGIGCYLLLARALRVSEVTEVVGQLRRRRG